MSDQTDVLDLAGQEAAERKNAEARLSMKQLVDDDLKWLMSDKRGRRVMWRLLERSAAHRQPYVMGGQPADTAFRCGVMNQGLWLTSELLRLCPGDYQRMIREQNKHG